MYSELTINNNITMLQLGMLSNNVYIVTSGNDCIVIDCPFDNGQLLSYIQHKGYNLQAILLTHGHFDHCGGVATLLDSYNVPVYCNGADWQLCANAHSNRWGVQSLSCTPTHNLTSGRLTIGVFAFDIILTPGHTAGGVCIVYGSVLFSGDTLFAGSVGRTDLGGDMRVLMSSLTQLAKLKGQYTLCAGHGQLSTLSDEKATNPYMVAL